MRIETGQDCPPSLQRRPRGLQEGWHDLAAAQRHYDWLTGRGSLDFAQFAAAELALWQAQKGVTFFTGPPAHAPTLH
jgi:hypothetical protein